MATVLRTIPLHFLSSAAHTAAPLPLPAKRLPSFTTYASSRPCFSISCSLQTVIPLHLPPGDTSTERTLLIDGSSDQIEAAKQSVNEVINEVKGVPRRSVMALILSSCIFSQTGGSIAFAKQSVDFREYIDTFDGYSLKYPQNWVQVRGANADIFFRDPYVLDENLSVELSSPSSSRYKSVEDLGPPEEAGKAVLRQYLTEFMSTRLGVRRESSILSTTSRVADDGRMYYQVEVNIKSFANNNELAVMPEDRIPRLEWDRRYLSVLGVENNQLYELRLQVPENVFFQEENDLREVMDSFRVKKLAA